MTLVVAGVLVALSLAYSFRVFQRCRQASEAALTEEDELELRLAQKRVVLELKLGRRMVQALGRVALFGCTGLAVWELTGGSAHYLPAGIAFLLGFVGWAGCGELERRLPQGRPGGRRRLDS